VTEFASQIDSNRARECPKCAEPVAAGETACGFCGYVAVPRKAVSVRMAEAACLALVLALIILVCRIIGRLLGV
jgi:hypothetical protein